MEFLPDEKLALVLKDGHEIEQAVINTVKERPHVGQVLGHEFVAFSLESHIPDNNAPHRTDIFLQMCGKRWDRVTKFAGQEFGMSKWYIGRFLD